jgi:hypothetical protein
MSGVGGYERLLFFEKQKRPGLRKCLFLVQVLPPSKKKTHALVGKMISCGCGCVCGVCPDDECGCECHALDELSTPALKALCRAHGETKVGRSRNETFMLCLMESVHQGKIFKAGKAMIRAQKKAKKKTDAGVAKKNKTEKKKKAASCAKDL